MTTPPRKTAWPFRALGKGLFGVLAICCLTNAACPEGTGDRPAEALASQRNAGPQPGYDVTPRRLDLIAPGTVVEKTPPKGWSHLIIKSHPRAGTGDVKQLSKSTAQLTALLHTVILANVQAEKPGRHRLTAVAVGLGTKVNGQDIIVSPEKQKELGANLGFLERMVLSRAQEKLRDVQVVARSNTMALIDCPNLLQRDGKHRPVVLRYAVLVDAASGRLDTLLWVIDRDERGGYVGVSGAMEWLPPNKMEDCVLHVDASEFSLGVPSENAFALDRIPQGQKQLAVTDDLKLLAARMRLTEDMAGQLETKLRAALRAK
jgi:hypothetical protein